MAADLATIRDKVTEVLNASAPGTFTSTIDSNNKDRVEEDITEACRYGAMLIARAILSNPNHAHRNLFVPGSPLALTHGSELPDTAALTDIIEIQRGSSGAFRPGAPRSAQEIESYRENANSIYGTVGHSTVNSPLNGYYSINNGRIHFTGAAARGYFPVINRGDTTGVAQVETITIDAGCSSDGNAGVTVTAAGMTNSPKTIQVSLNTLTHATPAQVANAIYIDCAADPDISGFFTVTESTADVIFTAKGVRANDSTMNIAVAFGGIGPSDITSSTNTTAGVVAGVTTLIPDEYESAWVALAVGFTLKEGDNLYPIAQYYLNWGLQELQSIADMGVVRPLPPAERAMKARSDV